MATRWNGTNLEEDLAFEHGLMRRMSPKKARADEILFYFDLMRRIRKVASGLSRRDDELIQAVLRHGNLTDAARDLSPERAEILRCYLSQRLKKFKEFSRFLFPDPHDRAPHSKDLHPAD